MGKWRTVKQKRMSGAAADLRALQEELYSDSPPASQPHRVLDTTIPKAPAPPRLTPQVWAASCLRRERKCGYCEICRWEAVANRWHDWSPWRDTPAMGGLSPAKIRPRFNSIDAALVAWFEWQIKGRWLPSNTGIVLDLIEQGAAFSGTRAPKRDNALLRRCDDIVHVGKALDRAYANCAQWGLSADTCRALLLDRTSGITSPLPTFAAIAEARDMDAKRVQRVVKAGRRSLQVELAARGLVPLPASRSGLHWDIDVRRRELLGSEPRTGAKS